MPKDRWEFEAMLLTAFRDGMQEAYSIPITKEKERFEKEAFEDYVERKKFKYKLTNLIDTYSSATVDYN